MIGMLIYLSAGTVWLNHPIHFYRAIDQKAFFLLPMFITFIYLFAVSSNIVSIIYMEWFA
jgi:hypothetical protein